MEFARIGRNSSIDQQIRVGTGPLSTPTHRDAAVWSVSARFPSGWECAHGTPYHVPKQAVPADVFFPGQPALAVNLFLSDHAESHLGYERPSDVLNAPESFVPTKTQADEFIVLNADAILTVLVDVEHEFGEMDIEYAALAEVLIVTPAVSHLIREGKTYQIPSLMQTGKGAGMRTLDGALLELVQTKVIEPEEAYARSLSKPEFQATLERHSIPMKLKAAA